MNYSKFLTGKSFVDIQAGFEVDELPEYLFAFQKPIVKWALRRGRAGLFCDTGLGKTIMQAVWAAQVSSRYGNVLIAAPLSVAHQTVLEVAKFGITIKYVRHQSECVGERSIFITNYEMLESFDLSQFVGIVLDESSIIKHQDSKTRNRIITATRDVPFKLSCTATPSPNDHMELGNQAEFLGAMSMQEMLAMFFTHDSGETSKWRLKGHGRIRFWEWLSTWAVCIKRPSDLGFDDTGYDLPPLQIHEHVVDTAFQLEGCLSGAQTLSERNTARRLTIDERVAKAVEIANSSDDQCIIWCNLNDESSKLTAGIPDAVEVTGSMKIDRKEIALKQFADGSAGKIVTKPSIAGFGLNWQHCHKMIFVGLNDSWEQLYQAIRRCHRYGQTQSVQVHLVSSALEGATLDNIKRKEAQAAEMSEQMVHHMRDFMQKRVVGLTAEKTLYAPETPMLIPSWVDQGVRL